MALGATSFRREPSSCPGDTALIFVDLTGRVSAVCTSTSARAVPCSQLLGPPFWLGDGQLEEEEDEDQKLHASAASPADVACGARRY